MKLTGHMLVKNEENWIWYSIMSVINHLERLIIFDTGSTDKTLDIIHSINSKKINLSSQNIPSRKGLVNLRQKMIDMTKTSWFLIVDGDEVWSRGSLSKLKEGISDAKPEIIGAVVKTRNCVGDIFHYQPVSAGRYQLLGRTGHYTTRAYKKHKDYFWQGSYPNEFYADTKGNSLNNQSHKLTFSNTHYYHLTHLKRSNSIDSQKVLDRIQKYKLEIGLKANPTEIPETFQLKAPTIVPSPFTTYSKKERLMATLITPLKNLRRLSFSLEKPPLLFALLVIFLALLPTLPSYYFGEPVMFQNHDHIFHLVRLWHIEDALSQGIILPNWLSTMTFGLGSPVFLFSWFLPYYMALPFRWLGLTLADSLKSLFLLATFFSGITIYILAKKLTNKTAALAAIAFYLLSPTRLNFTFTRGSIGEIVAMSLIPLILFVTTISSRWKFWALTLLLSVLSLTHNITFIFTCGLLVLWAIVVEKSFSSRKMILASIASALTLTAFFWLPAFIEREFTHYHETARFWYTQQFVTLKALLISPWQYGPPFPETQHLSMSFQIGKIHWLIVGLSPLIILKLKQLSSLHKRVLVFIGIAFISSIFFQLKLSKPIWDNVDAIQIFIMPWRLQIISLLTISLLAAFLVRKLPLQKIWILLLFLLLIISNRNHFFSARGDYAEDGYLKNFGHSGGSQGEFLPIWTDTSEYHGYRDEKITPPTSILVESNAVKLLGVNHFANEFLIDFEALTDAEVIINHYYFPGWTGFLDDNEITLNNKVNQTKGRMNALVPNGRHQLRLNFTKTPIRNLSATISFLALLLFLSYSIKTLSDS